MLGSCACGLRVDEAKSDAFLLPLALPALVARSAFFDTETRSTESTERENFSSVLTARLGDREGLVSRGQLRTKKRKLLLRVLRDSVGSVSKSACHQAPEEELALRAPLRPRESERDESSASLAVRMPMTRPRSKTTREPETLPRHRVRAPRLEHMAQRSHEELPTR
jgi:hypothetical protein